MRDIKQKEDIHIYWVPWIMVPIHWYSTESQISSPGPAMNTYGCWTSSMKKPWNHEYWSLIHRDQYWWLSWTIFSLHTRPQGAQKRLFLTCNVSPYVGTGQTKQHVNCQRYSGKPRAARIRGARLCRWYGSWDCDMLVCHTGNASSALECILDPCSVWNNLVL